MPEPGGLLGKSWQRIRAESSQVCSDGLPTAVCMAGTGGLGISNPPRARHGVVKGLAGELGGGERLLGGPQGSWCLGMFPGWGDPAGGQQEEGFGILKADAWRMRLSQIVLGLGGSLLFLLPSPCKSPPGLAARNPLREGPREKAQGCVWALDPELKRPSAPL